VELKKYCVRLLEMFGSFSYTRHILGELDADVRAEVAKHGGIPLLEEILNDLMSWKEDTDKENTEQ
jgi:geranylgeranyl diphosphate synthase type 3